MNQLKLFLGNKPIIRRPAYATLSDDPICAYWRVSLFEGSGTYFWVNGYRIMLQDCNNLNMKGSLSEKLTSDFSLFIQAA